MKQTLVFSAENYDQTTAAINCFGGTVGLTVAVTSDGEDDHVTIYPEVTINYLDWFPLCIATISDDGDLIADGVQVDDRGAAFSFNTRPFRQIRVRVSGVPDGEELTAKIELVVRS